MKERTSFVSNSSTSSYIIFYKERKQGDLLDDFIWHLQHIGERYCDEAYALEGRSLDELTEGMDWGEGRRLVASYVGQGRTPVEIKFSYHDRVARRWIRELEEAGRIVTVSLG